MHPPQATFVTTAGVYQLIDFGNGRRLDSLAGYLVDRPCPAAEPVRPALPSARWRAADASYDSEARRWTFHRRWPNDLRIDGGGFWLPFEAKPYGHVGCFPEQQANWNWLRDFLQSAATVTLPPTDQACRSVSEAASEGSHESLAPQQSLNLFAHTGGSTLAMVAGGALATHVDAAKPSVTAARQIAAAQPPADQRIRFLIEDAARYVAREVRRGRRYTLIALDPPSYGHGPRGGRSWRIERDLWPLLDDCLTLLDGPTTALLVSGHSLAPDQRDIADYIRRQRPTDSRGRRLQLVSGRSLLLDLAGRPLDAGYFVRASW